MRKIRSNQTMTVLTLVVALGAAVYLNWEYARDSGLSVTAAPAGAAAPAEAFTAGPEQTAAVTEPLALAAAAGVPASEEADKNYGEAQLVGTGPASGDAFFEAARLNRTRTRDEALDTLQKSLKNARLSQEEKEALTQELTQRIEHITAENEVESLIKAKGFVDCVAFLDGDRANITVMTSEDGLDKNQVAQIRDIVLSKCSVTAQNITVVEVK